MRGLSDVLMPLCLDQFSCRNNRLTFRRNAAFHSYFSSITRMERRLINAVRYRDNPIGRGPLGNRELTQFFGDSDDPASMAKGPTHDESPVPVGPEHELTATESDRIRYAKSPRQKRRGNSIRVSEMGINEIKSEASSQQPCDWAQPQEEAKNIEWRAKRRKNRPRMKYLQRSFDSERRKRARVIASRLRT